VSRVFDGGVWGLGRGGFWFCLQIV
jgi:hypothetical protein